MRSSPLGGVKWPRSSPSSLWQGRGHSHPHAPGPPPAGSPGFCALASRSALANLGRARASSHDRASSGPGNEFVIHRRRSRPSPLERPESRPSCPRPSAARLASRFASSRSSSPARSSHSTSSKVGDEVLLDPPPVDRVCLLEAPAPSVGEHHLDGAAIVPRTLAAASLPPPSGPRAS